MKEKPIELIKKTNLTFIDIKIVVICSEKPYSISELQKAVGIAYKNLLPHIRKLEQQGFLLIKDSGKGRKKEVRINKNDLGINYFLFGLISLWTPENILKKNKVLYEEICKFLESKQT